MRNPATPEAKRVDAHRIVVIGHSMGDWAAAFAGARDPDLLATGLISAAPINARPGLSRAALIKALDENMGTSAGMHTLDATPAGLADEVIRQGPAFDFTRLRGALGRHPLLLVTADDGLAPASAALAAGLRVGGASGITEIHIATDHSYSDHRIALETAVLRWLDGLAGAR